ncbi:MAG: DUF2075 domain-containing protein [Betaproteobacteria bacterium]|nr:DUF2075 domain-containing protein [Betaproteobacteria bacterium]
MPQAEFLYLTQQHRTALSLLEYGILKPSMFSLVTGDSGTGKSTLVRHLIARLGSGVSVGVISNTQKGFGELLEWVLQALGLELRGKHKVEMFQTLSNYLMHEFVKNRRVVLVVDEAQNMSIDALEELRMLSNVNVDQYALLQIVLVGQTRLRDKLHLPALQQLAQRIETEFHLRALAVDEVESYIHHRLKVRPGRWQSVQPRCLQSHSPDQSRRTSPDQSGVRCSAGVRLCRWANADQSRLVEGLDREQQEQGGWLFEPFKEPPPKDGFGKIESISKTPTCAPRNRLDSFGAAY